VRLSGGYRFIDKDTEDVFMLTLYLARHGETEWNVEKRMQGWKDSLLTEKGKNDAISLGKRLESVELEAIYTSTSKRAVDTAQLVCGERNIPIYYDEDLREIHLGDWEGKTHGEIKQLDPDGFECFWNKPHLYSPKNGESFTDVQKRAFAAIQRIVTLHPSGNVLIVTHGVVLKTLLARFKNMSIERLWETRVMHGTSLTVVNVNEGEYRVLLEGDVSHLSIENVRV
jgi:broad specificity phosphatase PhoE